MTLSAIHCSTTYQAQLAGFMPTSWSLISLGNDRKEPSSGTREGWDD
jgi:hypothetical protein